MSDSATTTTKYDGERVCQVVKLRPEDVPEYLEIHRNTPSAVLEKLREYHIEDYSIFYYKEQGLLISYFKYTGADFEADSKLMSQDPVNLEWWKKTDPMQETLVEGSKGSHDPKGWWLVLPEVFRFEG